VKTLNEPLKPMNIYAAIECCKILAKIPCIEKVQEGQTLASIIDKMLKEIIAAHAEFQALRMAALMYDIDAEELKALLEKDTGMTLFVLLSRGFEINSIIALNQMIQAFSLR